MGDPSQPGAQGWWPKHSRVDEIPGFLWVGSSYTGEGRGDQQPSSGLEQTFHPCLEMSEQMGLKDSGWEESSQGRALTG